MANVAPFLMQDFRRRTIPAPKNPADKATVVSIYPRELNEIKHTIEPGRFHVDAGTYDNPAILVVGGSSWWREIDENQPLLEIPNHSVQIADSIVRDYVIGLDGCDMDQNMPGLFWIPGDLTVPEIKMKYQDKLDQALVKQRNWYKRLVMVADSLWARSSGNPLSISDLMRLAANELNLVTKEWLRDTHTTELVRCLACGHLKDEKYPICSNCKNVTDKEKAKALGLVFAQ